MIFHARANHETGHLGRAVDLDDVAVGIEEEELRVTGGAVAADE